MGCCFPTVCSLLCFVFLGRLFFFFCVCVCLVCLYVLFVGFRVWSPRLIVFVYHAWSYNIYEYFICCVLCLLVWCFGDCLSSCVFVCVCVSVLLG